MTRWTPSKWHVWLACGAALGLILALPALVQSQYQLGILVRFSIYVILLTGLNFVFGFANMLSLAQGGLYGLGAYTAAILAVRAGIPPAWTLLAAPVVVVLFCLLIGIPTLRLRGLYFSMATLGAGVVLFLLFERVVWLTGGPNGLVGVPQLSVLGFDFDSPTSHFFLAAGLAVLGVALARNLLHSRTGRALRAVGVSEPAARVVGMDVFRLRLWAFLWSGAYAGVAGALLAYDTRFVAPEPFDFLTAVVLVVMLVVGGVGTLSGPVLGAALLIGLDEGLARYADYQPLIIGLVFLVAIQALPRGIAGMINRLVGGRRRVAAPTGAEAPGDTDEVAA